jgi:15-cis-phytoene synthase
MASSGVPLAPVIGEGPDLRSAYRACRRMQLRHDPTFYWATRWLARDVRSAVHALYGFVRGADQLVDGPRRAATPEARRCALDDWQQELERGLDRGHSEHPIIAALVDAGGRHDLPLSELSMYMDSMRMDCGPVRLRTRADLDRYMRGSAGAVGLVMAPLLGAPPELHETVARLGLAFQLTNFIRDVREDYALDRVYLPADERERFGVRERDIAQARVTPGFQSLLAGEVIRARELFASTAELPGALSPTMRPGLHLACNVYLGILDRVEALDFDVLGARAPLPPWQMSAIVAVALVEADDHSRYRLLASKSRS